MKEIESLKGSYNSEQDRALLRSLQRGSGRQQGCGCSTCRTLTSYYHLKNGGAFLPSMMKGLDPGHQEMLLKYVCMRASGAD